MFASNFPVDGMYSTVATIYSAFDEITAEFSNEERARMFGRTAKEFYRFPALEELSSAASEDPPTPRSHT